MLSQEDGKNKRKHGRDEGSDDVVDLFTFDLHCAHITNGCANGNQESKPAGPDSVEQEEDEKLVVAESNSVANPRTEVIHLQDAVAGHRA